MQTILPLLMQPTAPTPPVERAPVEPLRKVPHRLGTGQYRAEVRRLAPDGSVADLMNIPSTAIASLSWGRRLAATSTGALTAYGLDDDTVAAIRTVGHEVAFYRNGDLVWSGPIKTTSVAGQRLDLDAADVSWWLRGRPMRRARKGVVDLADAFRNMLDDCHPGRSYQAAAPTAAGIRGDVTYRPEEYRFGFEVLAQLVTLGLEWVAVGSSIYAGASIGAGTERVLRFPRLSDRDFLAGLEVAERGDLAATDVVCIGARSGEPVVASASASDVDQAFRITKRITLPALSQKRDLQRRADDELAARWPPPVVVKVPPGSQVAPSAPAAIGHLIPGAHGVVEVAEVAALMKLNQVKATVNEGTEVIDVTMVPGTAEL